MGTGRQEISTHKLDKTLLTFFLSFPYLLLWSERYFMLACLTGPIKVFLKCCMCRKAAVCYSGPRVFLSHCCIFFFAVFVSLWQPEAPAKCCVRRCISMSQETAPVEPVSPLQIRATIPGGFMPPPGRGNLVSSVSLPSNMPFPSELAVCLCSSGAWEGPLVTCLIEDSNGNNNKRNQFLRKMDFPQVSSPGPSFLPLPLCFLKERGKVGKTSCVAAHHDNR